MRAAAPALRRRRFALGASHLPASRRRSASWSALGRGLPLRRAEELVCKHRAIFRRARPLPCVRRACGLHPLRRLSARSRNLGTTVLASTLWPDDVRCGKRSKRARPGGRGRRGDRRRPAPLAARRGPRGPQRGRRRRGAPRRRGVRARPDPARPGPSPPRRHRGAEADPRRLERRADPDPHRPHRDRGPGRGPRLRAPTTTCRSPSSATSCSRAPARSCAAAPRAAAPRSSWATCC